MDSEVPRSFTRFLLLQFNFTVDKTQILLTIVFFIMLLLSAFFSASETALSYCNKVRLKVKADEKNKRAKCALAIVNNFDKALSTLMVGNDIVNVVASTISTLLFVQWLGYGVGALIATIVTTLLVFFFGETFPKNIAKANSDKVTMAVAYPITFLMWALTPVTIIFQGLIYLYKRIFKPADDAQMSEEDLSDFIEDVVEEGVINEDESDIIQNAIEFNDIVVKDVLTDVNKMVALDYDKPQQEVFEIIAQRGYSRYPVFKGTRDNIVGMFHTRSFLKAYYHNRHTDFRDNLIPAYLVSASMSLDDIFEGFKEHKTHMAIVTDNGRTLGMITMEDVLEEIVGNINESHKEGRK